MDTHLDNGAKGKSQSSMNLNSQKRSRGESDLHIEDHSDKATTQSLLQEAASESPKVKQFRAFQNNDGADLNLFKPKKGSEPIQRSISFIGDQGATKGKFVQSRQDINSAIDLFVAEKMKGGYFKTGSDEYMMARGIIHGQLISWADDSLDRPPVTIQRAIFEASEFRDEFREIAQLSQNVKDDVDLLNVLIIQYNILGYKKLSPNHRQIFLNFANGKRITKTTNKDVKNLVDVLINWVPTILSEQKELEQEMNAVQILSEMARRANPNNAQAFFFIPGIGFNGPYTPSAGNHAEDTMAPFLGGAYNYFKKANNGQKPDYVYIYTTYSPCHNYSGIGFKNKHSCSNHLSSAAGFLPVNKGYYLGFSKLWRGTGKETVESQKEIAKQSAIGLGILKGKGFTVRMV